MNKQEYVATQVAAVEAAIVRKESTRAIAVEALANCTAPIISDERVERELAVKSAINRVKEDQNLLRFFNSEGITALLFTHKVDFGTLCNERNANSRECKKRLAVVLNAISLNDAEALDKAEFRFFGALAANRVADTMSLAQAQHAMDHKTVTQARYMRSFLRFMRMAAESETDTIAVQRDSAMMRKVLGLFA